MRKTAIDCLPQLAARNDALVFIGSDLKAGAGISFQKLFPERFFMEGICEQHILGMAAGMAMTHKIPYVAANAAFLIRRAYEQLFIDICKNRLKVRLLAHGAGFLFAPLGATHTVLEDFAVLRAMPAMTILAPCDVEEVKRLMPQTVDIDGPVYIRCSKGKSPHVNFASLPCIVGRGIDLVPAGDIVFISTGVGTAIAHEAVQKLIAQGVSCGLLHIHTVKPLDSDAVLRRAATAKKIIVVEEHSVIGGLGSAVAAVLLQADQPRVPQFHLFGFPDAFPTGYGDQQEQFHKNGFTSDNLARIALQ